MKGAAVLGVGHSRILRNDAIPLGQLALEAARAAAADANIEIGEIDGLVTPPVHPAVGGGDSEGIHFVGTCFMQKALKISPLYVDHGGMLVTQSLIQAANAVAAGFCKYALVWRALHNPRGRYGLTEGSVTSPEGQFRFPYGYTVVSQPALMFQRHMHLYGSSREELGRFVVRNRNAAIASGDGYWAQHRPEPLTLEAYLDDRMVSAPIGVLDCDLPIQFVGAYILTSAGNAWARGAPAAYVRAMAVAPQAYNTHYTNGFGESLEEIHETGRAMADRLWSRAGVLPRDVDVPNLYDGFSVLTSFWAEALGFCEIGEGLAFVADPGRVLNPSTGNLGWGRTHGYALLADSIQQVRGKAGARQAPAARISVATVSSPVQGGAFVFGADPD
jgi:acetyl-CoA acetyltransferase